MAFTPATLTSSFTTTTASISIPIITPRAAEVSLPRFTPAAACFTDLNLWAGQAPCENDDKESRYCDYFHLADPWFGRVQTPISMSLVVPECYYSESNARPATECPVSYTAASTSDIEVAESRTSRTLICCPTPWSFSYGLATTTSSDGLVAHFSTSTCFAPSPTISPFNPFYKSAGQVPLLASSWSMTTSNDYVPTRITETFTTASDVILARQVSISFEISKGITCAPNCASPYTGGAWPTTEAAPTATITLTPTKEEDGECGSSQLGLCGLGTVIIIAVTVPVGITLLCCVACCWCCSGQRGRERRRRKNMRKFTRRHGEVEMVQAEGADHTPVNGEVHPNPEAESAAGLEHGDQHTRLPEAKRDTHRPVQS
ncbi:Hypothetical protein D9617_17g046680 [Elsinoe fawcettii]|nr:Hypothetical protein D9617_17g046680 [Elsinoe fawcettii]